MRRQDEERLRQRNKQNEECDEGKDLDDLVVPGRHEQKRHKRQHGREHADGDRADNGPRPGDRRVQGAFPPLPLRGDALSDDHGVDDDDTDEQEEREHRAQVQRQVRDIEEQQRGDDG